MHPPPEIGPLHFSRLGFGRTASLGLLSPYPEGSPSAASFALGVLALQVLCHPGSIRNLILSITVEKFKAQTICISKN